MSLVKKGASAFGKLLTVAALAATFLFGAGGVLYMSLQGEEMRVPEVVGRDLVESEKELASLGLRIKKRADRYSTEKPNTILEQLPKAGDTVKTGQMILVVTSKTNPEGDESPVTIKKNTNQETDDSEKIEELISDKPKKTNKNNANASANANKKKTSTTRDVIGNNSNANSNSETSSGNTSNSSPKNTNTGDKSNKNTTTDSNKSNSNSARPNANKPAATGGDTRPRRTPQP